MGITQKVSVYIDSDHTLKFKTQIRTARAVLDTLGQVMLVYSSKKQGFVQLPITKYEATSLPYEFNIKVKSSDEGKEIFAPESTEKGTKVVLVFGFASFLVVMCGIFCTVCYKFKSFSNKRRMMLINGEIA